MIDMNEISNDLKSKKPIPTDIYKRLRKKGTLTGSTVFCKDNKDKKDIDILYYADSKKEIQFLMEIKDLYGTGFIDNYDGGCPDHFSFYVKNKHNRILNIIGFDNKKLYSAWKEATQLLKMMIDNSEELKFKTQNKPIRTALFQSIRTALTAFIDHNNMLYEDNNK